MMENRSITPMATNPPRPSSLKAASPGAWTNFHSWLAKNRHARYATPKPISARMMRVRSSARCSRIDMRSMPSSSGSTCGSGSSSWFIRTSQVVLIRRLELRKRLLYEKRPVEREVIVVSLDRHHDTEDQHGDHRQQPVQEDSPREAAILAPHHQQVAGEHAHEVQQDHGHGEQSQVKNVGCRRDDCSENYDRQDRVARMPQ